MLDITDKRILETGLISATLTQRTPMWAYLSMSVKLKKLGYNCFFEPLLAYCRTPM